MELSLELCVKKITNLNDLSVIWDLRSTVLIALLVVRGEQTTQRTVIVKAVLCVCVWWLERLNNIKYGYTMSIFVFQSKYLFVEAAESLEICSTRNSAMIALIGNMIQPIAVTDFNRTNLWYDSTNVCSNPRSSIYSKLSMIESFNFVDDAIHRIPLITSPFVSLSYIDFKSAVRMTRRGVSDEKLQEFWIIFIR